MRVYTFTHFWLSTMAQGIQAGHAKDELTNKYIHGGSTQDINAPISVGNMLRDWSLNHKTHIALNGGNSAMMEELWQFLAVESNSYPWSVFHEDKESLEGLLTSIAVVLPERIYEVSSLIRNKEVRFEGNTLRASNWDYYNENMIMYKFIELENTCLRYGEFTDFEKEIILKLNTYRLAS